MIEHKAFVFDHLAFARELEPILKASLASGDVEVLREFIMAHLAALRDPYEGDELSDTWEAELENRDVHEYGDYALTRFYAPEADIGLGPAWGEVEATLGQRVYDLLLGLPVGDERSFDPGRMGSYFQSSEDVERGLVELRGMQTTRNSPLLERAVDLLSQARGRGLYVTF
jgi:hypothetical protein